MRIKRWKGAPYMRLKLISAVLVSLLLVVATGCGSKKKAAATTTAMTTTTEAMTTDTTTTSSGGTALNSQDCLKLAAASQTFAKVTSGNVPTDLGAQLQRLQVVANAAPAAIKPDFEVLVAAGAKYAQLGLKAGQQPSPAQIQQLIASLDVVKLTQALQHISAWSKANCSAP